jgi:hypothetical protein
LGIAGSQGRVTIHDRAPLSSVSYYSWRSAARNRRGRCALPVSGRTAAVAFTYASASIACGICVAGGVCIAVGVANPFTGYYGFTALDPASDSRPGLQLRTARR